MYVSFDQLRHSVSAGMSKTIVAAAAHDVHTLEAVYAATKEFFVQYILVGNREKIMAISSKLGVNLNPEAIVDAADDADCANKAVALIRDGWGHILMKGLLETGVLLKAVLDKDFGIRDSDTLSHIAVLEVPGYHKLISVTDGGVLPSPTLEQKASIVRNAVGFYHRMGFRKPKVAALCASETVSERIPETVDAAMLQTMCERGELGDCLLEGPLSFDIAVSREAASVKRFSSKVSGDPDILLVPNISVGNIFAKGLIYWGGTKMTGCILGAKVPIVLVSRNATAEEKLYAIMLCMA